MTNGSRRMAVWIGLWLAMLVIGLPAAEPMTDEDVVRLVVQGVSVDRILETISDREPAFDLSEEMLGELRTAGVPPRVLEAMTARQQAVQPPETESMPVVEPGPVGAVARIHVTIPDKKPVIRMSREISENTAARWQLPRSMEQPLAGNLAFYVACVRPEHVPDHWRSKSPLGRDFNATPRHRLLEFIATDGLDARGKLSLEIPEWVDVELEADEAHDLLVGVALQHDDRYYTLIADRWTDLEFEDRPRELGVRLGKKLSDCPKTPGTLWGIRWAGP